MSRKQRLATSTETDKSLVNKRKPTLVNSGVGFFLLLVQKKKTQQSYTILKSQRLGVRRWVLFLNVDIGHYGTNVKKPWTKLILKSPANRETNELVPKIQGQERG